MEATGWDGVRGVYRAERRVHARVGAGGGAEVQVLDGGGERGLESAAQSGRGRRGDGARAGRHSGDARHGSQPHLGRRKVGRQFHGADLSSVNFLFALCDGIASVGLRWASRGVPSCYCADPRPALSLIMLCTGARICGRFCSSNGVIFYRKMLKALDSTDDCV